jgi:hypothetical protein
MVRNAWWFRGFRFRKIRLKTHKAAEEAAAWCMVWNAWRPSRNILVSPPR